MRFLDTSKGSKLKLQQYKRRSLQTGLWATGTFLTWSSQLSTRLTSWPRGPMPPIQHYYQLPIDMYVAVQQPQCFVGFSANEKQLVLTFHPVVVNDKWFLSTATMSYYSWQRNTAGSLWYISTQWNNGKTSHLQPRCFLDTPASPINTSRAQTSSLTPVSTCQLFTALSNKQQAMSTVPVFSSPSIFHSKQC